MRILLISPQTWAGVQVSKHHYARSLLALGHRVDFVEPPVHDLRAGTVQVQPLEGEPGLRIVRYRPWFPYSIKFRARALFDLGMRLQARRVVAATGTPDVVWDFDNAYQFADLRAFGAPTRILQLVDQVGKGLFGTKHAQLTVALDEGFIERIGARHVPHIIVPHGLNPSHLGLARRINGDPARPPRTAGEPVRIGYVGNLLMPAVDRLAIDRTVDAHPGFHFDFVTPVAPDSAGQSAEMAWLRALAARPNCTIHTGFGPPEIVALASRIDAWMLCYDLSRDINAGVNSHKMLEYLATGSPVLSSWLKPYEHSAMIVMAPRGDNAAFPELLDALVRDMAKHDSDGLRRDRTALALRHDYTSNVETIARAVDALGASRTLAA